MALMDKLVCSNHKCSLYANWITPAGRHNCFACGMTLYAVLV